MASSDYGLGNYFNENISLIEPKSEELKEECLWEFNNFRQPSTVNNLQSIATMIKSLLFLEKGTYPDCPEMGVGIQNYLFDSLDDAKISEIYSEINDQITKYLPTIYIQNIIVKNFNNDSLRKTIGIGFEVSSSADKGTDQFFLTLQELPDSREIVSQIIY